MKIGLIYLNKGDTTLSRQYFLQASTQYNKIQKISKNSTADTSGSPLSQRSLELPWAPLQDVYKTTALDKEIEEFQYILDLTKPSYSKLKPKLSEEWLKKIKNQILKNT